MKKILILAGCLILTMVILTGCSILPSGMGGCSGTTTDPIVSDKPWANNNNYEYVSYEVKRYYLVPSEEDSEKYVYGDVEAEGQCTYTMYTIPCNIYDWELYDSLLVNNETFGTYFKDNLSAEDKLVTTPGAYSVLIMDYTLTYTHEDSEYKGKTDKMSSIVLYKTASLAPAYSAKVAVTETIEENSYSVVADYVNGKNIFEQSGKAKVETKISTTTPYDNELLYYVVRASSSLTAGGSASLSVHNAVYTGLNNADTQRNMQFTTSSSVKTISGIDADKSWLVPTYFDDGEVEYVTEKTENEDIGYRLPVNEVSLYLGDTNRGAVKTLYYSTTNFNFMGNSTSKLMLKSVDYETTKEGIPTYAFVMLIDNYKISEKM